ncbi:MAG: retention module-containing protein, partial [Burkholderiaceae bacterium]|nr:retention module-containing protein [Burkholderiaceae bacterium]
MAASQISAQARGVVVILQGNAWVVASDGSRKAIRLGDEIQEGQVVLTEDGTRLELALPNGQQISVESGRELLIDGNLLGLAPTDPTEAALKDLNSGASAIARILAQGGDLSTELEATAAGLSGGDASDSHSFVRVLRISEEISPLTTVRDAQGGAPIQTNLEGNGQNVVAPIPNTNTTLGSPTVSIPNDGSGAGASDLSVAENASTSGSFTISAPDGLTSLTIGTTVITAAALSAATPGAPVVVPGSNGSLTVTGYNSSTGVVSYSFDPTGSSTNHSAGNVIEHFNVVVTDPQGDTNSASSLDIRITDTAPVAVADSRTVTEDQTDITGNLVTGVNASADTQGADSPTVTGAQVGDAGATQITTGVGSGLVGTYGTLTIHSDGSYSYVTNAAAQALNVGDSKQDVFSYTLKDSDGSFSTTTVTMTVTGASEGSPTVSIPNDGSGAGASDLSVAENAS